VLLREGLTNEANLPWHRGDHALAEEAVAVGPRMTPAIISAVIAVRKRAKPGPRSPLNTALPEVGRQQEASGPSRVHGNQQG
jgi:hypothetical protein